jgi:hypothetical protein
MVLGYTFIHGCILYLQTSQLFPTCANTNNEKTRYYNVGSGYYVKILKIIHFLHYKKEEVNVLPYEPHYLFGLGLGTVMLEVGKTYESQVFRMLNIYISLKVLQQQLFINECMFDPKFNGIKKLYSEFGRLKLKLKYKNGLVVKKTDYRRFENQIEKKIIIRYHAYYDWNEVDINVSYKPPPVSKKIVVDYIQNTRAIYDYKKNIRTIINLVTKKAEQIHSVNDAENPYPYVKLYKNGYDCYYKSEFIISNSKNRKRHLLSIDTGRRVSRLLVYYNYGVRNQQPLTLKLTKKLISKIKIHF